MFVHCLSRLLQSKQTRTHRTRVAFLEKVPAQPSVGAAALRRGETVGGHCDFQKDSACLGGAGE